jgi:hypothetical protein
MCWTELDSLGPGKVQAKDEYLGLWPGFGSCHGLQKINYITMPDAHICSVDKKMSARVFIAGLLISRARVRLDTGRGRL